MSVTVPKRKKVKKVTLSREEQQQREALIRKGLTLVGILLTLGVLIFVPYGGYRLFHNFYFDKNETFIVRPEEVTIRGNTTVKREIIVQNLALSEPFNGFEYLKSDQMERLRKYMPNIKSARMTYIPTKGIDLYVEERTPLARLNDASLMVDEEGMLFAMTNATQRSYPTIGGFDITEDLETPGKLLSSSLHCMLAVLATEQIEENKLPSRIVAVRMLSNSPEDGLRLILADGRRIAIAWPGLDRMEPMTGSSIDALRALSTEFAGLRSEKAIAKRSSTQADDQVIEGRVDAWRKRVREAGLSPELIERLQYLRIVLAAPIAEGRKHFNAMTERITASE